MKRTQYTTMVLYGVTKSKWQRVYTDEDGKYYIKKNREYVCINGTPSEKMMEED